MMPCITIIINAIYDGLSGTNVLFHVSSYAGAATDHLVDGKLRDDNIYSFHISYPLFGV